MAYQGALAAPAFQSAAYAYQQAAQQSGLLQPGQIINVNGITVTVERYLSQGGFAHVYVVQSQALINGTRQHVLKRMAVPDESMLREVKKEVDVMKLLRGHPNIVNFIEASSQPMGNGAHEVFILMEFCAGGGIIDMMNRRLRERLTESEILTIFVNVCEGLACMHNLKPPLLHRDLKVENILQASATSYKLCDFGSATTTATRAPSTAVELRALEHDLNRHTTLQYRAPEMVDVYLRRPVDEKSDIWALGVLLYKLCYYTTPFEEHGPLAILNVSYKTPPYPVYSTQMNGLIASMLREHGAQRPSVFDLLDAVHKMHGTQSKFHYNRASSVPQSLPAAASQDMSSILLTRRRPSAPSVTVPDSRGEDVSQLAPSRRGRPSQGQTLLPPPMPLSPIKSGPSKITEAPPRLPPVRMEITRSSDHRVTSPPIVTSLPPVWSHPPGSSGASTSTAGLANGRRSPAKFENKFDSVSISSTLGTGKPGPMLGSSEDVPANVRAPPLPSRTRATPPARLNPHHRTGPTLNSMNRPRDAFETLNSALPSKPLPMSLGSQMSANASTTAAATVTTKTDRRDVPGAGAGVRSPPVPYASSTNYVTMNNQQQQQPPGSPRLPPRPPGESPGEVPVDERFPSIEEVERQFSPKPPATHAASRARSREARPAISRSGDSLQLPSGLPRQLSPSPSSSQQRSRSPSRNAYRPLPPPYLPLGSPAPQHSMSQLHPQGPRARSPPVPSKDVSNSTGGNGIISLSEAGGRLAPAMAAANATLPSTSNTASTPTPILPQRLSQSTSGATSTSTAGSRFTTGMPSAGGLQPPNASAARSPGKRSPASSGAVSDASTSSATSTPGAPLSRRRSMQTRPSYLRTPSTPSISKHPVSGVDAGATAVKTSTAQPVPPPKSRDWLTGEDDLISTLGAPNATTVLPTSSMAATTISKHERRSSRIVSSPRKDTRESAIPSAIPAGPSSSSPPTRNEGTQSPRKTAQPPSASGLSTPVRSTGTGMRSLPTRSDTYLSTESSGGEEDGPEEATPNANFVKRKSFIPVPPSPLEQARFSQQHHSLVSPTRPTATGGSRDLATLREEAAKKPLLKKPPLTNLAGASSCLVAEATANNCRTPEKSATAGGGPSKRQSVQDIVDVMRASVSASAGAGSNQSLFSSQSPNRTPRKQTSTQDLMEFDSRDDQDGRPPLSPVRNATGAAAARSRKARGGGTSHLRAGSINTTFTAAVVIPMMRPSHVLASIHPSSGGTASSSAGAGSGNQKPIQGGPRARPQSLFLPSLSSETYLRPPSAEPSPSSISETSSPSSANAEKPPRTLRRLSISDMVHKFEAMNTGDLPPIGSPIHPREGGARPRVPSGAHIHPRTTGSKPSAAGATTNTMATGTGMAAPWGPSQAAALPTENALGSGFHQPQMSLSSGTGESSSALQALPAAPPYQRQPRAPDPVQSPRSESPIQISSIKDSRATTETNQPRRLNLNTVLPADFLGPASSPPDMMSSASTAAMPPRAGGQLPAPPPEQPYQGVGKLIAEWHKKSEANNNNSLPIPKVSGRAGLR